MKNEIEKAATNNAVALSKGQQLQVSLARELEASSEQMGQSFSEYGKRCVVNAIAGIFSFCANNAIKFDDLDPTLLRLSLQNIGYTELNMAAIPSEVYIDARKFKMTNANGDEIEKYAVTIKPQGAGNEKLVRKYGVGLQKDVGLKQCWLIREGDEFTLPSFNGLEMTPPKWTPKSLDKKVIMVVYPALKVDGSVEYLIATRESIKPNIIAQIRQNTLYSFKKEMTNSKGNKYSATDYEARDAFYKKMDDEFEKLTVDQILNDPEWLKYVNPTYTSGGSKEAMILRKMKNNALKNYPKEYDNFFIRQAVEGMFEEKDETLKEKAVINREKTVEDTIKKVDKEIESDSGEEPIMAFEVDDDGVVQEEKEEAPEFKTADNYEDEI